VEREAFDLFASLQAEHWWFRGRRALYTSLLEHVLRRDLAREPDGLRVLDVGCGAGGWLEPLSRFGLVTGLELDEPSIRYCREQELHRTLVGRVDALPVPPGSQDLVCLWDVLEHTPDDVAVLREARRALRPGGHLALSVPAYQFLYANNDRVAHHYRRYTRGRLLAALRAADFTPRKATYVNAVLGVGIIPAVLLIKLKERLAPVRDDPSNNLTFRVPRALNGALAAVFGGERHLLRHVDAPFGHSLFAVARKAGP
jgi:2-polyprenyl-3-methyl-5-hydroxy-6-metoxy-1,4-benzoquinol methylase